MLVKKDKIVVNEKNHNRRRRKNGIPYQVELIEPLSQSIVSLTRAPDLCVSTSVTHELALRSILTERRRGVEEKRTRSLTSTEQKALTQWAPTRKSD
jgi:hypothetical protein